MLNEVTVRGGFTALNVKSGKCVLQFELDPKFRDFIPKLVGVHGADAQHPRVRRPGGDVRG